MSESLFSALLQAHAFAIGLLLGSFANAAITRLPYFRSMLDRSHCDTCGHAVRPRDLIPVVSFVLLRGRCRDCDASLDRSMPLVEILGGLIMWLLWRRLVPDLAHVNLPHVAAWFFFALFLTGLIIATYSDIRHHIIPDETSSYAIPVAIGGHFALNQLGYSGWLALDVRTAVIGCFFGAFFFGLVAVLARLSRGSDAMGWGDVKLVALLGAMLGPMPGLALTILMASFIGAFAGFYALVRTRGRTFLPFGPSLALAAAIWVFFGDRIIAGWFPAMQFLLTNEPGLYG